MPRLSASPRTVALVGWLSVSVRASRLCPFGSGNIVMVTSAPKTATKATRALVSPSPILGNKAVSAYVPTKAPIFPEAAAIPWLDVRTRDREDLSGVHKCRRVGTKLTE